MSQQLIVFVVFSERNIDLGYRDYSMVDAL